MYTKCDAAKTAKVRETFDKAKELARKVYDSGEFDTLEDLYSQWRDAIDKQDFLPVRTRTSLVASGVVVYGILDGAKPNENVLLSINNIGIDKAHRYDHIKGVNIPEITNGRIRKSKVVEYSWDEAAECLIDSLRDNGNLANECVFECLPRVIAKSVYPEANVRCDMYDVLVANTATALVIDITSGIDSCRIIGGRRELRKMELDAQLIGYNYQRVWDNLNRKAGTRYNVVATVARYNYPIGSGGIENYYGKSQTRVRIPFTALLTPNPADIVERDSSFSTAPWAFKTVEQIEAVRSFFENEPDFWPFYKKVEAKVEVEKLLAEI